MFERYGVNRVLEPNHVLSTSAWKVDNNREIYPNEIRISVRKLHIERTSFKQICIEANNNPQKIKDRIMDIVIRRGKLHNPITDTGGVLYGVVEEIGPKYNNKKGLKVGDEIICNASLAAIPLYISHITKIDMAYTQVDATGYAILFEEFPVVKPPEGIPVNLLLFAYDGSGTLYAASEAAKGKSNFMIVGNNLLTNLLFGYVVRKATGPDARIVCLFDNKTDIMVKGKSIDNLMESTFNEIHYLNILRPVECLQRLNAEGLYDMTVNCADIPGAETINILSARYGGTVFFANLMSSSRPSSPSLTRSLIGMLSMTDQCRPASAILRCLTKSDWKSHTPVPPPSLAPNEVTTSVAPICRASLSVPSSRSGRTNPIRICRLPSSTVCRERTRHPRPR